MTALDLYCRAVDEAAELVEVLRVEGRTYTTGEELVVPRPEVRMLDAARRAAQRRASDLGLMPASRARPGLRVGPEPGRRNLRPP